MNFYVSLSATEATLEDGRPLIRGETIDLPKKDYNRSFNARLIAEGQLISISAEHKAVEDAQKVLDNPASPEAASASDGLVTTSEGGAS